MLNSKERKNERLNSGLPDVLSSHVYNLAIGACILYGFLINALLVYFCEPYFVDINQWVLIIGYFISCFVGCAMTAYSKNPFISFIGYNLVVVPIGALLSVCLPEYDSSLILSAIVVTGVVVTTMTLLATIVPNIFAKMGCALFIALFISIVAEIIAMFLGYGGDVFNWVFVVIFSLYIGYDWNKAQMYPKTLDNAVDSALDLYLDITNLFIRLLDIFSKIKSND